MENTVKFYIWNYSGHMCRITTSHVLYHRLDTACIMSLDIMLDTMRELSDEVAKDGLTAVFRLINDDD